MAEVWPVFEEENAVEVKEEDLVWIFTEAAVKEARMSIKYPQPFA